MHHWHFASLHIGGPAVPLRKRQSDHNKNCSFFHNAQSVHPSANSELSRRQAQPFFLRRALPAAAAAARCSASHKCTVKVSQLDAQIQITIDSSSALCPPHRS